MTFGGDPTVAGWLITFLYALAACAAARAWWWCIRLPEVRPVHEISDDARFPIEPRGWLAVFTVMVVFGINKQLDVQTLMIALGRAVASQLGLYSRRRTIQLWFIGTLATVVIGLMVAGLRKVKRDGASGELSIAVAGIAWLGALYLMRAVEFDHVDVVLGIRLPGATIRDVIESVGLLVVVAGGAIFSARASHSTKIGPRP